MRRAPRALLSPDPARMPRLRRSLAVAALLLPALAAPALAQPAATPPAAAPLATPAPGTGTEHPARAEDVASAEAIVTALYATISGDAGVKRDWHRFHSLFHPGARLIPSGPRRGAEGQHSANVITPQQYVERAGAMLERDGFHEVEIARTMEQFGNVTHVFSTYESRRKLSDPEPFMRGINSIQLFFDGTRWWVLSIYWQQERPDAPIPAKYLPR